MIKILNRFYHATSLKANIIANFAGNGVNALLSLIFLPLYLKYIGAEGYGLIGIFGSLQIVLSLFDSGLSTTLNKELARLSVLPATEQKMRNLVKTLGGIYWIIGIGVGLIAIVLSPIIANYWVQPKVLRIDTITYSFILLSTSLIFQFPAGLYSGGLLGLQRHVMLNSIRIMYAFARNVGALVLLIYVSQSILIFFTWLLLVMILQTFTLKYYLWHYLPKNDTKPYFDKQEIKNIWRFASGMFGIGITGILITQIDKIILSKILSLEQFGYYSISCSLGLMIYQIVGPLTYSYFPKFSNFVSQNKEEELKNLYHQGCQLISVLVFPVTFIMCLFSKELIFLWTKSAIITENTWIVTSIYAFGTGINGLMNIPYVLTLSFGWTKLSFYQNIFFICLMIPITFILATKYGPLGGALSWAIINLLYFFITPHLVHRKLLKGEVFNWYWNDTVKPILPGLGIVLIAKYLMSISYIHGYSQLVLICIIGVLAILTSLVFTNNLKNNLFSLITKYK